MQGSNLIKIIAAFGAGILVALGSALVYVRVNDQPKYQAPSIVVPPLATTSDAPDPASAGPAATTPGTQTAESPSGGGKKSAAGATPRAIRLTGHSQPQQAKATFAPPITKPAIEPVQIAQNSPMPAPPYTPPQPVSPQPRAAQDPASTAVVRQAGDPDQPPPPTRQPHVVTLAAGTTLVVRLGETISTDHNYAGDTFRGTLDAPVIMDGFIIADKGSKVLGKVVEADKGGHLSGTANLTLTLNEIHSTDGQTVRVETSSFDKKGPRNTVSNAEKIGGGAALGAIIGAIAGGGKGAAIGAGAGGAAGTGVALATHGKGAVIPSETKLTFQLSTPVTITEKLN